MKDSTLSCPLSCTDPATFEAVWSRVMQGKTSPITLKETATTPLVTACLPSIPANPTTPDIPTIPDIPARPTFPSEDTILPCFGEFSVKNLLETAILSALDGLEAYKKLERQLPYKLKASLLDSLNQRKKILNQLETAYFLLVGEDFLLSHPSTTEFIYSPPVPADQRIRTLFRQTQELQLLFKKSALETEDVCFTTLFLQLDKELKEEISTLHRILESLFWLRLK